MNDLSQGCAIFDGFESPRDGDYSTVPNGDNFVSLIPTRRNIAVRSGKDRQNRLAVRLLPLWVGPRLVLTEPRAH